MEAPNFEGYLNLHFSGKLNFPTSQPELALCQTITRTLAKNFQQYRQELPS